MWPRSSSRRDSANRGRAFAAAAAEGALDVLLADDADADPPALNLAVLGRGPRVVLLVPGEVRARLAFAEAARAVLEPVALRARRVNSGSNDLTRSGPPASLEGGRGEGGDGTFCLVARHWSHARWTASRFGTAAGS